MERQAQPSRNPWTGSASVVAAAGRRTGFLCPSGADSRIRKRYPRVPLRSTRGYIPSAPSGRIQSVRTFFILALTFLTVALSTTTARAQQNLTPPAPAPIPAAQPGPAAVPGQTEKPPPKTFLQIFFSGGPLGIANMIALIGLSLPAALTQ